MFFANLQEKFRRPLPAEQASVIFSLVDFPANSHALTFVESEIRPIFLGRPRLLTNSSDDDYRRSLD
jgi:hypothetical protein